MGAEYPSGMTPQAHRLNVFPQEYLNQDSSASPVARAFERARAIWDLKKGKGKKRFYASDVITVGNLRLYSSGSPSRQIDSEWKKHLSPFQIFDRLRHSTKKDILYLDSEGTIYRPGLEIELSSLEEAEQLAQLIAPLTPAQFSSASSWIRLGIQIITWALSLRRRVFNGERVLTFYSAEDRSYYGSIYTRGRSQYFSVLGSTREAVEKGVSHFAALLSPKEKFSN